MTEFNVSESDGTVEIALEANGTSQFDYFVRLSIGDISTGENLTSFYALSALNIMSSCMHVFVHMYISV